MNAVNYYAQRDVFGLMSECIDRRQVRSSYSSYSGVESNYTSAPIDVAAVVRTQRVLYFFCLPEASFLVLFVRQNVLLQN